MSDELADATAPLTAAAPSSVARSRIAGYRLEQQIGAGGMAVVYQAVDERLERRVALKILAPALAADEAFRQRFIRESRAAAAVDDPHIIPVYEAGEADGVLFIAMRFVPAGDVRTLVRQHGPMAPARAVEIISSVASALDAAHAAGLVHRDVKPANMLIDARAGRPDHVYLSDFGLSKGAMSSSTLTGAGQFLGTADYAAPEQIDGRAVDGRTDQYALACAAFELLAGAPPFQRDQATSTIWAQMSEPPPPLRARRPEIPAAVDQVFAAALAKAPGGRYRCCRDFAYALRCALGLMPNGYGSGPEAQVAPPAAGPAARGAPGPIAPGPIAQAPVALSPQRPAWGAQATPAGFGYQQAVPAVPQFDRRGQVRGAWRQDWTAWALILAGPAVIVGLIIAPLGHAAGAYGALMFFGGLLAIPVALIAKLVRRQRRRRAVGR